MNEIMTMNKPLTVAYEDFKQELTNLINVSGLPAFAIEQVLVSFLNEVSAARERQYQLDKARYEKAVTNIDNDNQ